MCVRICIKGWVCLSISVEVGNLNFIFIREIADIPVDITLTFISDCHYKGLSMFKGF